MVLQNQLGSVSLSATATIPELQQSKTAVLNTLASRHSRRSYEYAIDRFIAWYCSEPRLEFNRSVVVRYRSFLERLSLSAATINLHLSAIRRLADESAESGWLSPELTIGIRRVKGVKRLGRKMGNWLTRNEAQELVNAASKTNLRGWRDGAMVGLLLGCGLRTLGSRGLEPRSAAIERGPLGHCQSDRQVGKNTNRTSAMVGQGTCRCLAPTFWRERR
jgi:site-specific recombinase XerD